MDWTWATSLDGGMDSHPSVLGTQYEYCAAHAANGPAGCGHQNVDAAHVHRLDLFCWLCHPQALDEGISFCLQRAFARHDCH